MVPLRATTAKLKTWSVSPSCTTPVPRRYLRGNAWCLSNADYRALDEESGNSDAFVFEYRTGAIADMTPAAGKRKEISLYKCNKELTFDILCGLIPHKEHTTSFGSDNKSSRSATMTDPATSLISPRAAGHRLPLTPRTSSACTSAQARSEVCQGRSFLIPGRWGTILSAG